ncbi:MAG: DNA cytosine methyltransferase [Acidobacteriia bacterium]|nr:DNA cytosine methyltransferase [Terriglobia bacterium]
MRIGLIHPYEIRKLTIPEIKALASYPERFQFLGSYRDRWARAGSSVPPLLMRAIAERIRYELLSSRNMRGRLMEQPVGPFILNPQSF